MSNITNAMAGIRMSFKSYSKFFMTREAVIMNWGKMTLVDTKVEVKY